MSEDGDFRNSSYWNVVAALYIVRRGGGISYALLDFFLLSYWDVVAALYIVRRGGGLATLCVPFPFPLAAGPLQSVDYQELRDRRSLFRFCPLPYKSKLLTAVYINEISIAFAMLTPDNQYFAVRGGFEPPVR